MASPVCTAGWAQQPRSQRQISDSSYASSQGWDLAVYDINVLLEEHERGTPGAGENYQGITTGHWTPSGSRTHCVGPDCKTKFGLLKDRHHHCRRCGDLFCKPCCSYKRRLNVLAHPDPNGKLYSVCRACFDQGPQTIGQFRRWTPIYQQLRASVSTSCEPNLGDCNGFVTIGNFREKVNIPKECRRLKEGFKASVNSPSWKRALLDVKKVAKVPEWQKASYYVYGTLSLACAECSEKFSLTRGRYSCTVCGAGVCGSCAKKELIAYIANGEPLDSEPNLAIIKIVGCPLKEPDRCEYLRVCQYCSTILQDQQVHEFQRDLESEALDLQDDPWDDIIKVNDLLSGVQVKIETQLPKYQELIEALEATPGSAGGLPRAKSNTQILAKAQGDLADHFTQWVMVLQRMKRIKPTSKGQMVICRNMIKCKCEFYQENMYTFRSLRRKLEAVTPLEVLVCIQGIVDRNAINSSYLSLKQLALEILHLCSKHKIDDNTAQKVIQASQTIEEELQKCVEAAAESWDTHQHCADELLQLQIKEHRLIRPSRRLTQKYGSQHVQAFIRERTSIVLQQIYLQLNCKCADRSFKPSKEALKTLGEEIRSGEGS